jgi:predicted ATP-dependent serine protease
LGKPKGGKSNLCIRFADYLSEYFGSVCYIAAEEGISETLQLKIKDIGGSDVVFVILKDRELIREYLKNKKYDFVFIDSINKVNINDEFLEILKAENQNTSFNAIVQVTKSGNFKGDQALTHNCDFIIKVIEGIAYHEGRFNTASEISIFDSPLYEKNPNKKAEKTLDTFKHKKEKTKPNSDITNEVIKPLSFGQFIGNILAKEIIKNNKTQAFIDSLKKNKLKF